MNEINKSRVITRNTTCVDILTAKDLDICCENCYRILDPLISNKAKSKSNRFKSERRKCEQQWDISCATTIPKVLRHKKVRERLGLSMDINLDDEFKYKRQLDKKMRENQIAVKNPLHHQPSKTIPKSINNLILH